MAGTSGRVGRRAALGQVLPIYTAGSMLALVLAAAGAILGYVIGNHSPLGVFVGAAVGLIVAGGSVAAFQKLFGRKPVNEEALVDGVLGQGRRTGRRDPDAT